MRHRKRVKKLGRDREHRLALLRNQAISLLRHGRIKTTLPKAKATRSFVEKLITIGKNDNFNSRRLVRRYLVDRQMTNYLFDEIAPLFKDRSGGYTRIYRLGFRKGDGAEVAILELVKFPEK